MGYLSKILNKPAALGGASDSEFHGVGAWLDDMGGVGRMSSAGVKVSPERSLSASAVFACVRVIAEDVAKLPLIVYRRMSMDGGQGKERATDIRLYDLLRYEPNKEMGPFDFKQALQVCALVWGNGYAEINRDNVGDVAGIWPLESWKVCEQRDEGGNLYYEYREGATSEPRSIRPRDMIHIKGISANGIVGWMLSEVGAESMGLYLAAMKFTSSYFANGASTGEAIIYPHAMKPEEFTAWVSLMRQQYEGAGKQHKTRYFDRDVKIHSGGAIAPKDSQLIDTLHFSIEDVARYFRVTPHKIGHLLRATFNNIESLDLDHYKSTIQPRLVQNEEEYSRKLLSPADRQTYIIEHLVDALLRADYKTRTEGYSKGLTDGWLSRNEVRAMENLNPVPGGEKYYIQQNLAVVDAEGMPVPVNKPDAPPQSVAGDQADAEALKANMMPVFAHAAARVIDREANAASRCKGDVRAWAAGWYQAHRDYVSSELKPACASLAKMVGVTYADAEDVANRYADAHVAESLRMIEAAGDGLDAELERWRVERAPWIAKHLTDEVAR